MNHSLLQSSFQLEPITSDGDYIGAQRQFPGPTGFSMDDEDTHRRSGAVGSHLAQAVQIPATNGLRYNTQQSAMHDLPYGTSPTLQLMSPSDSCSETFSSATGPLYTHHSGLGYDRMQDYRSHRVTLQPPAGMSSTAQSPGNASFLGRGDNYAGAYSIPRAPFPPLASLSDITRASQYTTTSRTLDCGMDRNPNLIFAQPGAMYLDRGVPLRTADAPPFKDTDTLFPVISGNQNVQPEIGAKIHKGFFQVDEKWTCYRRNYFSISCSFSFHPSAHGPFFLKNDIRNERIHQFSMSISAIVNEQHGEVRELVQHTPKRDKQSERPPQRVVLQPSQATSMVPSLGSTSSAGQHGFPLMSQSAGMGMGMEYNSSYGGAPQQHQPPTQHTFERIQFQKATANNGKRRAQQQYYNLVVDLYAEITSPLGNNEWVKIARKLSHPMVVRGRSPGHYKDGRRDSSTSMGPDGGSGGAGDGSGEAVLPPGLGQASRSHIALLPYESTQRGGHSYGRADYHQMATADHSPLSASPHISSSSSSTFDIGMMSDSLDPMDSIKSTSSMEPYHDPSYGMMDVRKDTQYHGHLPPPFEYGPVHKTSDSPETTISEGYDSIASIVSSNPSDGHFLRHHPRTASQGYHHSSPGGYDTVYSARSGNGSGSGSSPYYRHPSSQSLCT